MLITVVNIIARSFHFILFLAIGNRFGSSSITDTVFYVYAPLAVIMSVAAGVSEAVIMPGIHRAQRENCVKAFVGKLLSRSLLVVLPITLLTLFITWFQDQQVSFPILAILMPIPLLATLSSLSIGLLNARSSFKAAVIGPIYGSITALPILLFVPVTSVSLALILLLFEIGRMIGLRYHLQKKPKPVEQGNAKIPNDLMSWVYRGIKFQAISSFLGAINPFIDILFAKKLAIGAITHVEYANRLWNMIPLIFAGPLIIIYARWSHAISHNKLEDLKIRETALRFGSLAIVISIAVIPNSHYIIDILYGLGEMDAVARLKLSRLLSAYLAGASPFIVSLVYIRAFNSLGRQDIITWAASLSVLMNIILNWILITFWGLTGIGLATSLTHLSVAIFLSLKFENHPIADAKRS